MSVEVVTFGCRLNAFESEVIAREASIAGLTDTIVINSCAVTNESNVKSRLCWRKISATPRTYSGIPWHQLRI